jgi:hypothetical protein
VEAYIRKLEREKKQKMGCRDGNHKILRKENKKIKEPYRYRRSREA